MKKVYSSAFVLFILLFSCGPAAEDRVQMDRIAKRMSDSIGHLVDSSLNDPILNTNLGQNIAPAPAVVDSSAAPH